MIPIPDDIAATAEALVDELHANPDVTFAGILAGPTFERRIAEALAAERERCAAIADAKARDLKINDLSARHHNAPQEAEGYAYASDRCREIAAAIRNPSTGA